VQQKGKRAKCFFCKMAVYGFCNRGYAGCLKLFFTLKIKAVSLASTLSDTVFMLHRQSLDYSKNANN
jgi:hypothetical protein